MIETAREKRAADEKERGGSHDRVIIASIVFPLTSAAGERGVRFDLGDILLIEARKGRVGLSVCTPNLRKKSMGAKDSTQRRKGAEARGERLRRCWFS